MVKSSVGMVKASRLLRLGGLGGSGCTGAGADCMGAGADCMGVGGVGELISGAVNGASIDDNWLGRAAGEGLVAGSEASPIAALAIRARRLLSSCRSTFFSVSVEICPSMRVFHCWISRCICSMIWRE